jgi:ribonucleoside-diphosphate reductase alpha chain
MLVLKRNGDLQPLDLQKIHSVLTWACEGYNDDALTPIRGVSVSQIEMQAQLHLHERMTTKSIHETLIRAASELISEDHPNYDHVAARLVWFSVRKEAFKNNLPPHLSRVVRDNVDRGVYTSDILEMYSDDELNELNRMIRHERDDLFRYAGAEQMRKKYLCQNRKTKQLYESFQFPYILVAAILFGKYPKHERMTYVKKYYDLISTHVISLPTPIMAGVRTQEKQFSSCVLVSSGDSLNSIKAVAGAIVDYASRKAGLGVEIGAIRAEGQEVRNGNAITTGILPFAKLFNAALKSCSQGSVRGASATFNYPIWHLEFEKLIELKNEKGTDETRLRTVDYCIHLNGFMYRRWAERGNITFFSPDQVPDLYEAFYSPRTEEFERLYTLYEADETKAKKTLPADVVFQKILTERFETGRLYILHADLANMGPFYERVSMTNLCTEILQPTVPLGTPEGRVALCTLSAINWGKFTDLSSEKEQKLMASACEMAVRGLDALLDYQNYPLDEAKKFIEEYRTLGIGIIGFAHWLTRNRLPWGSPEALSMTHTVMESMAYHLTSASIQLAKEFGPCKKRTKYHDGWMPMDRSPISGKLNHDWDALRALAKQFGIRNATLMAMMPSETSSQTSNETNGLEPPRDLITIKGSKEGVLPQLVPEFTRLNASYETLWNVKASDYLQTIGPVQKFNDQAISANTSYDPSLYDGRLPLSVLAKDLILAYKLGLPTLYYNNTRDSQSSEEDDGCAGGACKI